MTDPTVRPPSDAGERAAGPTAATPDGGPGRRRGRGRQGRSLWGDAWRGLWHNPVFIISALLVLTIASMAAFPWLWTGIDPTICGLAHSKEGPTAGHPFGFNVQGCDLYAQTIYGARPSVIIAVVCTAATTLIGVALGTLAAFYGGKVDTLISRLTDVVLGLPLVLGGILILSMLNSHSIWAVSAILIALGWGQMTRIMRGSVLTIMNIDYVQAARAIGAPNRRVILRHILPNAIAPAIVIATIALGGYVSLAATLTFLGVGLQLPEISWGLLISSGQGWAVSGYPHLLIFPCIFLVVTVLSFVLLGDALRDALDPRLR
ncbi:MAG: ABC transporter permease [Streptosporangiaceae bacterium]